ncbi:MAG: tetratricopeptide repeat protein [Planctomycetaceae bacterium]|nr:tetratricopeptide repeat protein [Planctomycetaceae bacterium]
MTHADRTAPRATIIAGCIIVLALAAAFANSFCGSLVFDDAGAISDNPSIRRLWPLQIPLSPPTGGETVTGRPVLNLSLAVNYAISGTNVWSYHATNLAVHIAAALLLFGLLRRTFLLPTMRERWGAAATPLSLAISLLWGLHPLQTESVTYIVQRAESLMALFYFLTLYGLVRGATVAQPARWYLVSILACALGMGTKEVMVSAPVIAFLYDRTFLSGSFREALRKRYGLYLGLAATWLLLLWILATTGSRGNTAGFGQKIDWWSYACTQFGAIAHYLRLSAWPSPLVFDYGVVIANGAAEIVPYAAIVTTLLLLTMVAMWKWPKAGFLGVCFFALLAPTSSVVPVVTQTIAEHRMYLPLTAVVIGAVLVGYLGCLYVAHRRWLSERSSRLLFGGAVGIIALTFAALTVRRNMDYASEHSVWQDVATKMPRNARAHNNLAKVLLAEGQLSEAMRHLRTALEIQPDNADAYDNLGCAFDSSGRLADAIASYRQALRLRPGLAEAHYNLGNAYAKQGRLNEAMERYRKAFELNPGYAKAHTNLGVALFKKGQPDEAMGEFKMAVWTRPDDVDARNNFGLALLALGRPDEAETQYRIALQIQPDNVAAHINLGDALIASGRKTGAVAEYRRAIEIRSDSLEAQTKLGSVLIALGRWPDAIACFRKARQIDREDLDVINCLAWLLATCPEASLRNGAESLELAQLARWRAKSEHAEVFDTLAAAYAETGRFKDAVTMAKKGLELATKKDQQALASALRQRLDLYRSGMPYHARKLRPSGDQ